MARSVRLWVGQFCSVVRSVMIASRPEVLLNTDRKISSLHSKIKRPSKKAYSDLDPVGAPHFSIFLTIIRIKLKFKKSPISWSKIFVEVFVKLTFSHFKKQEDCVGIASIVRQDLH